ncbi:MAG: hypothetical protein KF850_13685 [Labilithrix sp.]|nr:hypothetical protein [Labilithrix sp.]
MKMLRGPLATVVAVAGAAALAVVAGGCQGSAAADGKPPTLSHAGETWCPDRFEAGPSDTCFAIPEHPSKETPVLVYLHGMYTGHGSPEEWAAVSVALDRGFAVVIPRGKRGLCAWRAELKDHYCWPLDAEDTPTMKGIVGEWERVLWQVDALLEGGTHKRYVLGSSNGGFFAAYLATHRIFPGQAYAVVNGGALGAPSPKTDARPVLLVAGQDEPEPSAKTKALHDTLAQASWAHGYCPRGGSAALTTSDVEAAVRFFRQDGSGTLKAQGGLYPCDGSATHAERTPARR